MTDREDVNALAFELVEALRRLCQTEKIITSLEVTCDRTPFDYDFGLAMQGHGYRFRGIDHERHTVRLEFDPHWVATWLIKKGIEFKADRFARDADRFARDDLDQYYEPEPEPLKVTVVEEDEPDEPRPGILRLPPEREE